jgi:NlpC/P60 family
VGTRRHRFAGAAPRSRHRPWCHCAAAGVHLPRTTNDQVNDGTRVTRAQLQPGDLVFGNGDGHVHLHIGGGQVTGAPYTGADVQITSLPTPWPQTPTSTSARHQQRLTPASPAHETTAPIRKDTE